MFLDIRFNVHKVLKNIHTLIIHMDGIDHFIFNLYERENKANFKFVGFIHFGTKQRLRESS